MKRLPKQNYTLEFKQEAVRQIEVEGKRQADVARTIAGRGGSVGSPKPS